MSKVALSGNALGTGTVTLAATNTNTTVTLNLPDTAGTVLIQDGTNTTSVVNLTATGTVNVGGGNISPQTGFKNRIINRAMTIDQRNAGAIVTPAAGQYTLDRWRVLATQTSKASVQRNAGAVTPPSGFANYLGITSLSAYSIVSTDFFGLNQPIEGFNVADLGWGTANAQAVTLSFLVRSSLTGTFGGAFYNSAANRSYPFSYTIAAANTWTTVSVNVSGDTSGAWVTDSGVGLYVNFCIGAGTAYSGTAGSWSGSLYVSATGATSVVGTSGATFYITGVQLEKGSTATPFEFRSIGTELELCQRYYEILSPIAVMFPWNSGTQVIRQSNSFRTTKRAAPSISLNTKSGGTGTLSTAIISAGGVVYAGSGGSSDVVIYDAPTASAEL